MRRLAIAAGLAAALDLAAAPAGAMPTWGPLAPAAAGGEPGNGDEPGDGRALDDGQEDGVDPEAEEPLSGQQPGVRYTADLSDEELRRLWEGEPASLGSISMGVSDTGRLINGVQFPEDGPWVVVAPENAYGTQVVVESIAAALREVEARFPGGEAMRVGHLSASEGGPLRPHRSHQTGRDADLPFYYRDGERPVTSANREKMFDLDRNWAFVRALVTHGDVQMILVDRRIQKRLLEHARKLGEDPAWLASLFEGDASTLRHARRHRDHFHVRYWDGRAQELGRRVTPLLAARPEHNVLVHRIRPGDTLLHLALRLNSTVELIRKANGMKTSFLRAGHTLKIPLRGPCTVCPVPPDVVVPPRRLPPVPAIAEPPEAPEPSVAAATPERAGAAQAGIVGGPVPTGLWRHTNERCTRAW